MNLDELVAQMIQAEMDVHETRENITNTLIENKMHEFFSVDWTRLRRQFGKGQATKRVKRLMKDMA